MTTAGQRSARAALEAIDDQVLELRGHGRTFAAIARTVGLERADDAVLAFNRALRRRPPDEQDGLRRAEVARLDRWELRIRDDEQLDEATTERKLRAIARLRTRLLAD
jgi:hypothetical protein